ncbi:MAG: hypothetical protein ACL93V_00360 [Candidatus Electrothrix sp. YB6]
MGKLSGVLSGVIALCMILFSAAAGAAKPAALMYVANEGENNVMVVNLETEEILATIPTGYFPHAIVFAAGKAYVNNRGSEHLTVINTETLEAGEDIPLPNVSFQLALSPDGKTVAVSYKDALKVSLIDVASDTVSTLPLSETPEAPERGFPEKPMKHPHWSKHGRYLYVQNNIDDLIIKIDTDTFTVATEIPMPGSNHDLVASSNDKVLYAVNQDTNDQTEPMLTVIDTETDSVIENITIPLSPDETGFGHHGGLTRNGKTFYFCNERGYSVSLVDTVNMEVRKSLEVGKGAGHPVFSKDNKKAFIIPHKDNIISVIDTHSEEIIEEIEAGEAGIKPKIAHSSYITNDGKYLYVINVPDQNVVKINTVTLKVVSTIPIGQKALAFAVTKAQL